MEIESCDYLNESVSSLMETSSTMEDSPPSTGGASSPNTQTITPKPTKKQLCGRGIPRCRGICGRQALVEAIDYEEFQLE
jgi:hypothetical protein